MHIGLRMTGRLWGQAKHQYSDLFCQPRIGDMTICREALYPNTLFWSHPYFPVPATANDGRNKRRMVRNALTSSAQQFSMFEFLASHRFQ